MVDWAEISGYFTEAFRGIFNSVIEIIFKAVCYSLSVLGYYISVILLQILDLIQYAYRSLAGLDGGFISIGIKGSDNPDMLISLLTSSTVSQAFISCCIVGIFLLIITTIFQILKVEYTTEGSGNSKMSIVGKSLKSLTTLLIIPALAIFGIIIGNNVLKLIDTATGGRNSTRISNLVFTTGASESVWKNDESVQWWKNSVVIKEAIHYASTTFDLGAFSTLGVVYAIAEIANEADGKSLHAGTTTQEDLDAREKAYNVFMQYESNGADTSTEDKSSEVPPYTNILTVWDYYNVFAINYVLIIFAGAIILKCMTSVCFGLIDRVFQGLVLFIISPMVIGMSPVKDSLASWRTKFIQKVLSAYGVVISMNLYFILVQVFINVELTFNGDNPTIFGAGLLTGIVQLICIITATIGVEKLAGELGSYFGGGNALADGKTLMQDTSKTISDATKTATTVAKVGVGTVTKGVGIASKVGTGAFKGVKGAVKGFASGEKGTKFGKRLKGALGGFKEGVGIKMSAGMKDATALMDQTHDGLNKKELRQYKQVTKQKEKSERKLAKIDEKLSKETKVKKLEKLNKKRESVQTKSNENAKNYDNFAQNADTAKLDKAIDAEKNLKKVKQEEHEEKAKLHRDQAMVAWNAAKQWGQDGMESLIPKSIKQIMDEVKQAEQKGSSYSPEGQQAYENVQNARAEKRAKKFESDVINKAIIDANRNIQTQKISSAVIEKADFASNEFTKNMKAAIDEFNSIANDIRQAKANKDAGTENRLNYDLNQAKAAIKALDRNATFKDLEITSVNMGIDVSQLKNAVAEAVKNGSSANQIMDVMKREIEKLEKQYGAEALKAIKEAANEIKSQLGS